MNGTISLDTNIVIKIFQNAPLADAFLSRFVSFFLPVPVVAELLYAAKNSSRQKENLALYNKFIAECSFLNTTRKTADYYSDIRLDLKRKGKPIPENDLWIAAICMEQNIPIATEDAHFDAITGLEVVRWNP